MEKPSEFIESNLRHFIYFDYKTIDDKTKENKIIFECDAKDILEADELYKEADHGDPAKQCHVGCRVKKVLTEKAEGPEKPERPE